MRYSFLSLSVRFVKTNNPTTNQNTMRKYLPVLWLVPFLLLAACEKVVDFQASAYEPKLVVYGALFADSIPGVLVGQTQTYYGWEEFINSQLYVEGAEVSLGRGQEAESLSLGSYAENLFNIWNGNPSGYRLFQYEEENQGPDSSLRLYEGNQVLEAGQWYDFKASYKELGTERRIYIPERGQGVNVTFRSRDTSYVVEERYLGAPREEVDETVFELVLSYEINDSEENVWHKPVVRSEIREFGYWTVDPQTGFGQFIEDSVTLSRFAFAPFERLEQAGRLEYVARLGSASIVKVGDNSSYQNFTMPIAGWQYEDLYQGDTLTSTVKVSILTSYAQDEAIQYANLLQQQLFTTADPLAEPVIVNNAEDGAVGMVGGFSTTEEIEVPVRYWFRQP